MKSSFWFKSTWLKVIPGEDEETNPYRFGKSLAEWLVDSLRGKGFEASFYPEDWGWEVACCKDTHKVFIACGNVDADGPEVQYGDIIWHCFIETRKASIMAKLFKKNDQPSYIIEVSDVLSEILETADHIYLMGEP